jgi:hypothetical protein
MLDRTSVVSLVGYPSIRCKEKRYVLRNRSNGHDPECHGRMSQNIGCRWSSGWLQIDEMLEVVLDEVLDEVYDEVVDEVTWHSGPH